MATRDSTPVAAKSMSGSRELSAAQAGHHLVQGESERDAGEDSAADAEDSGAEDDAQDVSALGAEGDADAEFIGALDGDIRHDAVEADGGQRQGQGRKGAEEPGHESAAREFRHAGDPMLEIANIAAGLLVVVDGVDGHAHGVEERERRARRERPVAACTWAWPWCRGRTPPERRAWRGRR